MTAANAIATGEGMLGDFEQARLATLGSLDLLDTPPEREFDAIVQLAQRLTSSKIALVSLIDRDRQWLKAKVGFDLAQTRRELAFCAHVVATDQILIVPDASIDERFATNPLVTSEPRIRFYAGVPIRAEMLGCPEKLVPLGTLCVIDSEPRDVDSVDIEMLVELAHLVEALIAARSAAALAGRFAEERGRSLQKLDQKNRQLRQAERMANIGSWRLTLADNSTEWSEQTYAIHGVPVGDGKALDAALNFYPAKARATIAEALERTIITGEPFDVETDFNTAQGEYRRVRSMGELEMESGKPVALIGVIQDITSRYNMVEALRQAAHTDELTRIASRGRFNEYVDERITQVSAAGEQCALLLIDLDHFKAVNDQLGHQTGDEVLRAIASRLQAPYLSGCFAGRLGGDEFVLLMTDQRLLRDLPATLRRLLRELQHSVCANGLKFDVTATIGACLLSGDVKTRSELLQHADAALYEAKRQHRGSAMIAGQTDLVMHGQSEAPVLRFARP